MLVVCDVYARSLVRLADQVTDPTWAATLVPASDQVRANLDGLRDVLVRGRRASDGRQVRARSAERLVDAAEEHAARTADDPHRRTRCSGSPGCCAASTRPWSGSPSTSGRPGATSTSGQSPSTAASAAAANTRSGS